METIDRTFKSTPRTSPDSGPFDHGHVEVQSKRYVIFADLNRRCIDCSDGVCNLLGYAKAEMLTKAIDNLSYFSSDVPPAFDRFMRSSALEGPYLLRHKSGRPLSIRYRAWAFPDGCLAAVWEPAELWQQLYHMALLELDPQRPNSACELALESVTRRLESQEDGATSIELRAEMTHAAATLLKLLTKS
jgi:hypothetical protein